MQQPGTMPHLLQSGADSLKRFVFPLSDYMARLAMLLILLMGLITGLDVAMRFLFNSPMPAVIEFSQFFLALAVFLGIAYTARQKGHVSVDMLSAKYPPKLNAFISSVITLVSVVLFIMIGWQQILKSIKSIQADEVTAVAKIPYFPIIWVILLGCAVLVLVLLVEFLEKQAEVFTKFQRPWLWELIILATTLVVLLPPVMLQLFSVSLSPFASGLWGIGLLMVLIFTGFPIGFAMALIGVLGSWYLRDFNCSMMTVQMTVLASVSEYFFTVVPLFVAMGFVCFAANLSKDLYGSFYKFFGGIPGALSMATTASCAGFAAICGDSGATGATMGSVAIPEMLKAKYKPSLATGCVAAGGTLGILIPPSVGFIIYGLLTEQSIGKLFMAGIVPGTGLCLLFLVAIYAQCKIDPLAGPPSPSFSLLERIAALKGTWPILILFGIVMGGMYWGIFTATEAGAVGLLASLAIGFVLKRFTWKSLFNSFMETASITSMVFTIMIGVSLLNNFIAISELPLSMGNWIASLQVSRYAIFFLVLLLYLGLGCVMNIIPMMMLTLPILFPVIAGLGFDPIWFGVVMVIMMEMGQITPPVGLNVYIITGVAKDVPMAEVFKGVLPFIAMQVLMIILLVFFPEIATYLPDSMGGLPPLPD